MDVLKKNSCCVTDVTLFFWWILITLGKCQLMWNFGIHLEKKKWYTHKL